MALSTDKRVRILDAAVTVFADRGFFQSRVSDIADAAGVAGGTYLFALPGSPSACRDAWDEILRYQLDIRHRPCNFVEIMPRLTESALTRRGR